MITTHRYSTDERMNQELKDIQRASDPALGYLTKKPANKGPQKPTYKGSFPPNRFKIRPGYRWDGVERSNGFESKYYQKKHQRGQRQEEMDAWGKEDM
jgi:pre-mRNA-splicing factor CWC26